MLNNKTSWTTSRLQIGVSTACYEEKQKSWVKGTSHVEHIVRWSTWLPSGWPQLLPGGLYLRVGRSWEPFWPKFKFSRTNKLISCSKAQSKRLQCVYWLLQCPALENKQTAQPDSFPPQLYSVLLLGFARKNPLDPLEIREPVLMGLWSYIPTFLSHRQLILPGGTEDCG